MLKRLFRGRGMRGSLTIPKVDIIGREGVDQICRRRGRRNPCERLGLGLYVSFSREEALIGNSVIKIVRPGQMLYSESKSTRPAMTRPEVMKSLAVSLA